MAANLSVRAVVIRGGGTQQQVPDRRFHDIQKSVIFCAVRSARTWVWRNPELQETGITSLFAHHQHIHRFSLKSRATDTRHSLMMRCGSISPAQVSLWIAKPCGEFFAKSLIRSVEHTTWVNRPITNQNRRLNAAGFFLQS